jgi:xanthine dehydrogenase molybdopterin-binding subunit B
MPCSPSQVPNASPTAASASSDMYGGAALDACRQISERLKPYKEKYPGGCGEVRSHGVNMAVDQLATIFVEGRRR